METAHIGTPLQERWSGLRRTARTTGALYLGFFIIGILGTVVVRAQLFDKDDAAGTLSNLLAHESLARLGIALELGIVLIQILTAVWLFRLFRSVDALAAWLLVAFGVANAVVILGSAAMLTSALAVAQDPVSSATASTAATVQVLYLVSEYTWAVGGLLFGLWLIPMGHLAMRSGWLPKSLGWMLVAGGIGYIAGAFVGSIFPESTKVSQLLTAPGAIGELWIMGYLLIVGVRRHNDVGLPRSLASVEGRSARLQGTPGRDVSRPRSSRETRSWIRRRQRSAPKLGS
jgi:uncharacterized protein DUF4386